MSDRVFLTGGTGFVGANLARVLTQRGYELRCLIRPDNAAEALQGVQYERVDGTLDDEGGLAEGIRGCDFVVHCAALVSFDKRDRRRLFEVNAEGTARVAKLAREQRVQRMLYMSSVSAVGWSRHKEVLTEASPYNYGPLDIPYSDSKKAGEDAVLAEHERGLDAVIVNPSSMFGPGDRRKAQGSLLESVAYGKLKCNPPGGSNFADVRDVVSGTCSALEFGRAGERYILGGQNLTNRQLIAKICAVLGRRPPRFTMPGVCVATLAGLARAWESVRPLRPPLTGQVLRLAHRYTWYSSAKAEDELGYAAYPVEIAIKMTYDWLFDLDLLDATRVPSLRVH